MRVEARAQPGPQAGWAGWESRHMGSVCIHWPWGVRLQPLTSRLGVLSPGRCLEGPVWLQSRNDKVHREHLAGLQEGLSVSQSLELDRFT